MNPYRGVVAAAIVAMTVGGLAWYLSSRDGQESEAGPGMTQRRATTSAPNQAYGSRGTGTPSGDANGAAQMGLPDIDPSESAAASGSASDGVSPLAAISGKAIDMRGNPIANLPIALSEPSMLVNLPGSEAVTKSDGSFEIVPHVNRDAYSVVPAKPEAYLRSYSKAVQAGARDVVIQVKAASSVSGTVISAQTGKPISRFEVLAARTSEDEGDVDDVVQNSLRQPVQDDQGHLIGWSDPWKPTEDDMGRFIVSGLPGECSVTVVARAEGHVTGLVHVPAIGEGRTLENVLIRLEAGARVEGKVTDADGIPIPDAEVFSGDASSTQFLIDPHGMELVAKSDQSGTFAITTLGILDTELVASHPDYLPGTTSIAPRPSATTQATIVLPRGGTVEGTLTKGGQYVSDCDLRLNSSNRTYLPAHKTNVMTDTNGHFKFTLVPPGEARLSCILQGASISRQVLVENGKTTVVDIDVPVGSCVLEGTVLMEGNPPREGSVMLKLPQNTGESRRLCKLTEEGHFHLESLAASEGELWVLATSKEGVPRKKIVAVILPAGETVRQDIDFETPAVIFGCVVGAEVGDEVSAVKATSELSEVSTKEDFHNLRPASLAKSHVESNGRYQLDGLDAGDYRVLVVRVKTGEDNRPRFSSTSKLVSVQAGEDAELNLEWP